MNTYTCTRCHKDKDASEYYIHNSRRIKRCKPCYREQVAQCKARNRSHYTMLENQRRARKMGATPALTDQELKDMRDIYDLAMQMRQRGFDVQVDHTDPLTSDLVCGLHTPHNLQLLYACDNQAKKNTFEPYGVDEQGNIYPLDLTEADIS